MKVFSWNDPIEYLPLHTGKPIEMCVMQLLISEKPTEICHKSPF